MIFTRASNAMQQIKKTTRLALGLLGVAALLGATILSRPWNSSSEEPDGNQVACTQEALLCPDGSAVGRSGPSCAFAPCPAKEKLIGVLARTDAGFSLSLLNQRLEPGIPMTIPLILRVSNALRDLEGKRVVVTGTFTEGTTYAVESLEAAPENSTTRESVSIGVGEKGSVGDVTITLNELIADNRCPVDVECIEGGAITTNVTFASGETEKTLNMPSDEVPQEFAGHQISIENVEPATRSTVTIQPNDYRVTFRVSKMQ